ncbi:hypothetical protein D3C76_1372820 [compost metagenome]
MIDVSSWPVIAKLLLTFGPFAIGLPGVIAIAYTAFSQDYDVVVSSIKSNPYVEGLKCAGGAGNFKWRWMLVCVVSGLIAFPWWAIRSGTLDENELRGFPLKLKRRLVTSAWMSVSGLGWLVVAWALLKLNR